jgi:hypothetical protein
MRCLDRVQDAIFVLRNWQQRSRLLQEVEYLTRVHTGASSGRKTVQYQLCRTVRRLILYQFCQGGTLVPPTRMTVDVQSRVQGESVMNNAPQAASPILREVAETVSVVICPDIQVRMAVEGLRNVVEIQCSHMY